MRRQLHFALALVAIVMVTAPLAASAGGRYPKDCGRWALSGKLKTKNVSCSKAEKVVSKFARKAQEQGPRVRVKGFDCVGSNRGRELDIFCSRRGGRQLVHWRGTFG